MEEYYPGDEVIRTHYGDGAIGRIIGQKAPNSYYVEVIADAVGEEPVGTLTFWGTMFFKLYKQAIRIPDWEV